MRELNEFFFHNFQFWSFIRQCPPGVPLKLCDVWLAPGREAPKIAAESGGPRETLVLICAALLSSLRWRRRSLTATICHFDSERAAEPGSRTGNPPLGTMVLL